MITSLPSRMHTNQLQIPNSHNPTKKIKANYLLIVFKHDAKSKLLLSTKNRVAYHRSSLFSFYIPRNVCSFLGWRMGIFQRLPAIYHLCRGHFCSHRSCLQTCSQRNRLSRSYPLLCEESSSNTDDKEAD